MTKFIESEKYKDAQAKKAFIEGATDLIRNAFGFRITSATPSKDIGNFLKNVRGQKYLKISGYYTIGTQGYLMWIWFRAKVTEKAVLVWHRGEYGGQDLEKLASDLSDILEYYDNKENALETFKEEFTKNDSMQNKIEADTVYYEMLPAFQDLLNTTHVLEESECMASCTSAEFQRMAPAKNARIIGMKKKKSLGKKDKYNTLGEKNMRRARMTEAFTDEELDMDDDEWLEKMRTQRAAEKQARQERRDAEARAKRDAEEKQARLARGEYTEEEKKDHIKQNCKLLYKYIQTMEDDLWDAFDEAASPLSIQKGNPVGYEPSVGNGTDYFDTFPMYVKVSADREDDEVSEYTGHEIDYYHGICTYYPCFTLEDLAAVYLGSRSEADRFHSGKRNEEGFKKYFIEGTKVFENTDEIHDTLDGDAELFATVKWLMYESFGCLVAAAAKASSKNIAEAAEKFFDTEYAVEAGMGQRKEKFFFVQYAGAFYTDETVDAFMDGKISESRKFSGKALKENASDSDEVLVRVVIPDDYYDKYGNPVNGDKYDPRLQEIDNLLFAAGAETVWTVTSDPEAGWEGDDFNDTGFRRMTVAQLRAALESGIDESEIRVYDNDVDVEWDYWVQYMNKHPEIDPYDYTNDIDIYEDHRIYDINSLLYDSDEYVDSLTESELLDDDEDDDEDVFDILLDDAMDHFAKGKGATEKSFMAYMATKSPKVETWLAKALWDAYIQNDGKTVTFQEID